MALPGKRARPPESPHVAAKGHGRGAAVGEEQVVTISILRGEFSLMKDELKTTFTDIKNEMVKDVQREMEPLRKDISDLQK
eukprot:5685363-Pyramimonas_sp.AAC.1